jgi:hypothetical protein
MRHAGGKRSPEAHWRDWGARAANLGFDLDKIIMPNRQSINLWISEGFNQQRAKLMRKKAKDERRA